MLKRSPSSTHVQILAEILRRLPELHRAALTAYYCEGATAEEAAEKARMGLNAFREMKQEIRTRFAAAITSPCSGSLGELVGLAAKFRTEMAAPSDTQATKFPRAIGAGA